MFGPVGVRPRCGSTGGNPGMTCGAVEDLTTEATRLYPFVPSGPNFAQALAFFVALGFETTFQDGGLAGLRLGGAYFLLQNIDVPQWQSNQMITLEVRTLDAYWAELEARDLARAFPGCSTAPPKAFPWGRELHLRDPAGVCWHVRQAQG